MQQMQNMIKGNDCNQANGRATAWQTLQMARLTTVSLTKGYLEHDKPTQTASLMNGQSHYGKPHGRPRHTMLCHKNG